MMHGMETPEPLAVEPAVYPIEEKVAEYKGAEELRQLRESPQRPKAPILSGLQRLQRNHASRHEH